MSGEVALEIWTLGADRFTGRSRTWQLRTVLPVREVPGLLADGLQRIGPPERRFEWPMR